MRILRIVASVGFGLVVFTSALPGIYAFASQSGVTGAHEFHERFAARPTFAVMHVLIAGMS